MRACLSRIAVVGTVAALLSAGLVAQERFPGTSYITPFPAGDTYRMQVYGDAFAEGLLAGLADSFADDARVQLQRRRRPFHGIARLDFAEALKAEDAGRETVHIAIVMIGYSDRHSIRTSWRERIEFGSPEWREEYGARADRLIKTLKKGGTAVYWVGLPIMRRPEANEPAQVINEVVREKAYLNGIKYIDITAHFSDETGNYTPYGPDVAGKQRLVRERDGILFTWAGYRKLAHFVEREIKRDLAQAKSERSIPLAGSEAEQKRVAALRPRPPAPKGEAAAPKADTKGPAKIAPVRAQHESKADPGRIVLKTVGQGGREETVTLELPRPAIPAAVIQLLTRKDTGDRPTPMGDSLADDVGGGLVVLSSVTPLATGPGARRKAAPGQPYYQVWVKGERLPPRPGRSDDFTWPRIDPEIVVERPAARRSKTAPRS